MYVTRKADYAVRCVLLLAGEPARIFSAAEIAHSMSIPRSFLAKILQELSRGGIVRSTQGTRGGYRLSRDPSRINLLEVIEAVQGPSAANACAVDKRVCSLSRSCAVHPVWVSVRESVEKKLKKENFGRLAGRARNRAGAAPAVSSARVRSGRKRKT